jgi:hypothetical protein
MSLGAQMSSSGFALLFGARDRGRTAGISFTQLVRDLVDTEFVRRG